jgi:glyoxylase-like metal-dependent hydrolase (beta-lactamase superfamily II)
MKIHAIQTGTVAVKTSQRDGSRGNGYFRLANTLADRNWTEPLPIYTWVIEHPEGVIVIDTGDTARTSEPGYFPWWHPYYQFGVKLYVQPDQEIGPKLRAIGIPPEEVRWLILTHLHTDHAGGLHHFPNTEILVSRKEYGLASGWLGKMNGYLPHRWPDWFDPRLVDYQPDDGIFPESFTLTQAEDVLIVPTPGHTDGHQSVILHDDERTVFFAGDASYSKKNLQNQVIDGVSLDTEKAAQTLKNVLDFVESYQAVFLPSHDPESAKRLMESERVMEKVLA